MNHDSTQHPASGVRMLRLPDVKNRVGLGRSAIYAKVKRGEFPSPVHLGPRAVAWISEEISAWIATRIALSRGLAGSCDSIKQQHDIDDNVKLMH